MKNKKIFLILLAVLFILGLIYLYYYRPIVDDELFNFGFAKSILDGRVPYVDFNMIIPPLFPYFLSLILGIFGKKLLVYHILLVIMGLIITFISYQRIGFRAIALYCLYLIYPYTGYNSFCLLLFMLLISFEGKDSKYQDIRDAIIISLMFLTKHTLGLLILPSIIFSKHKKKTISIYVVSILLLVSYLFINHSIFYFIDYCVMGMFEFGSKNGEVSVLLFVELVIIIVLFFFALKRRKKGYYYLLCFQIMSFPVANYVHFLISFIPIMYYILLYFKKSFIGTIFFTGFSMAFFVIFSLSIYFIRYDYHFLEHYPKNSFMKDRLTYTYMAHSIDILNSQLDEIEYDDIYILGSISYWMKLNLDMPIDKYDIINHGNMGYLVYREYIKEIDDNCKNKKCLFIINDEEALNKFDNQVSVEVLEYVKNSYVQGYSSSIYSIYVS